MRALLYKTLKNSTKKNNKISILYEKFKTDCIYKNYYTYKVDFLNFHICLHFVYPNFLSNMSQNIIEEMLTDIIVYYKPNYKNHYIFPPLVYKKK